MNTQELFTNCEKPLIDRPLIAYAFLAQTTNAPGDLLSGLTPIFKPIAKGRVGKYFSSVEFATEVQRLYGIVIHPWAVDDLAPRLESAGLLVKNKLSSSSEGYVYADIEGEFDEVDEADIRLVIQKFIEFTKPILIRNKIELSEKALEEAFFGQLVSMDFHSALQKPDRTKEDQKKTGTLSISKSPEESKAEQDNAAKSKIETLCASFIVEISYSDRRLYDLVVRIASGALIAEVVLNIQDPGTSITLNTLKVILDAPFVMSLLDLVSEEDTVYARSLLGKLKANGAKLLVFRHSIEEIDWNLRSVTRNVSQGIGHGATARRLGNSTFKVYLHSVMQDVETALFPYEIKIVDSPSTPSAYQYLTMDDEHLFYQSLGYFQNQNAQERDAASLAGIIRLRQGKTAKMSRFHLAQYVFITENPWVAQKAAQFAVRKGIQRLNEVPPIVTDRYFAGLLWVLFGGKAEELTKYRLLANCTAVLEPRNDVIAKTYRFLSQLDENKAQHFRTLMMDHRAGQHLMQLTLGDSVLITSANDAEQLFEKVEAAYAQKHHKAYEEKLSKLTVSHEQQIAQLKNEAETLAERARLETAEGIIISGELEGLRKKSEELDKALADEKLIRIEEKRRLVERSVIVACHTYSKRQRQISLWVAVAAFLLAFIGSGLITQNVWGLSLGALGFAVLTYICFWKNPDLVFGNHLMEVRNEAFLSKIDEFELLLDELGGFEINWETARVVIKN